MAEAAGLALAVLPLLISAAENYEQCLRPIYRFVHFTSEVSRFQRKLRIQKTIFQNQCRILLEDIVDHDVAVSMLQNMEHPNWQDPDIEGAVSRQLEASRDACVTVVDDSLSVLKDLEDWCRNLADAVQEEGKVQYLEHLDLCFRLSDKLSPVISDVASKFLI